ncbi:excalibur calcium-binding domain-containing protein [Mycobacterium sp. 48b]|uniref:excalibur calcium-binding domain-containing protein n=1 Tax=Mycobacterium sp. 48b TaxID=3400426 RepID=UPI003AAB58A7
MTTGTIVALAAPAAADPPYASCNEAWEDGQSNIRKGKPGYRPGLDIDSDGIACEFGIESGV